MDTNTETKRSTKVEAHGVKGMRSTPWCKTFRSYEALQAWAEKNDAQVYGVRDAD